MKTYFRLKTWLALRLQVLFCTIAAVGTVFYTGDLSWILLIFCPPVYKSLAEWAYNSRLRDLISSDVNHYQYFHRLYSKLDVDALEEGLIPREDIGFLVDTLEQITEYEGNVEHFLRKYEIGINFIQEEQYSLKQNASYFRVSQWLETIEPRYRKLDVEERHVLMCFRVYLALLRYECGLRISSSIEIKYSMIAKLYLIGKV